MKQLVLGLALLLLSSLGGMAAEQTATLAIDKMTCALCPITVKKAIEKVEGVKQVSVDFETKQATVRYDDATTTLESIAQASTNAVIRRARRNDTGTLKVDDRLSTLRAF